MAHKKPNSQHFLREKLNHGNYMAALASISPWIPEDDVLLKNAVEAGASLEALAKGAVQFSRRFTVQELRVRWHSLLYDPEISAEASVRMVEFELHASNVPSKSNTFGNSKESLEVLGKRKVESIRSLYHAMRKKLHIEALNSTDLSFPVSLNTHDCNSDTDAYPQCVPSDHEPSSGNFMLGDCVDHYGLWRTDSGIVHHPLPQIKEDFAVNAIPSVQDNPPNLMLKKNTSFEFNADVSTLPLQEPVRNDSRHSFDGLMFEDRHNDGLDHSTAIPEGDFVDLPDSLNYESDYDFLFIDTGVKSTVNMSNDNFRPVLLCSPNDICEGGMPSVGEHNASASPIEDVCFKIPGGACSEELDSQHCSEVDVPQTLVPKSHPSELCGEVMHCTLNSEDPNIPDNDDIVFPNKVATPFVSSLMKPTSKVAGDPASTSNEKGSGQAQGMMNKREYPAQSFRASKLVGSNTSSEIGLATQHIVSDVKSANIGLNVVPKLVDNSHQVPSTCFTKQATLSHTMHERLEVQNLNFEESNAQATIKELHLPHAKRDFGKMDSLKQEGSSLASDQEEYESDADIPYFSSIEAMILDMDLGPYDQVSNMSEKVSRYHNDDAKRKIMRLEQSAHSSLQRAIASRGAFAILYGRHLKHYIKKTEVILGRATDDADVDIDLGREGRANKISRRQAVIRLEGDGSFWLKNFGRCSIFVNGKEVATGQLLNLNSSCLIEIRDLNFVFEMYREAVRKYVVSIDKRGEVNKSKFKWSPK